MIAVFVFNKLLILSDQRNQEDFSSKATHNDHNRNKRGIITGPGGGLRGCLLPEIPALGRHWNRLKSPETQEQIYDLLQNWHYRLKITGKSTKF